MEAVIKLLMVHKTILTGLKPKDQVKAIKTLLIIKKDNLLSWECLGHVCNMLATQTF
jgi:hypothetical protein